MTLAEKTLLTYLNKFWESDWKQNEYSGKENTVAILDAIKEIAWQAIKDRLDSTRDWEDWREKVFFETWFNKQVE